MVALRRPESFIDPPANAGNKPPVGGEIAVSGFDSALGYTPTAEQEQADEITDELLLRVSSLLPAIRQRVNAVGQENLEAVLRLVTDATTGPDAV